MQRLGLAVVFALVALTAWTVYRNVLSDDSAVRTMAERTARAAAGCADCKTMRLSGTRGVLGESFELTMSNGARVAVSCRRPYIAFGDVACTATKH